MGYGQSSPFDSVRLFIKRGGMPVSYTLIAINIATFLFNWFWPALPGADSHIAPAEYLIYEKSMVLHHPWTVLSYPLIGVGLFNVLFNAVSLWFIGGSLERAWGSTKFIIIFAALSAISALSLQAGGMLTHQDVVLAGCYYPVSALTVVFCLLNSEVGIRPYGLFTIRAKYLAMIIPIWLYFTAGFGPIANIFALGGCLAAYLYYKFGRSYSYLDYGYRGRPSDGPDLRIFNTQGKRTYRSEDYLDGSPKPPSIFNIPAQMKYRKERRKLEEFFRKSGLEDDDFRDSDSDNKR